MDSLIRSKPMAGEAENEKRGKRIKINYIDIFASIILTIQLLLFPLIFAPITTDPFAIPKQALLAISVLLLMLLLAGRLISVGRVRLSRTPFDIPVLLFALAIILSSLFASNKAESLLASIPLLFGIALFFLTVHFGKRGFAVHALLTAYVSGAALLSFFSLLSFQNIYVFPFPFTKSPFFTPIGSLLDQSLYLAFALPLLLSVVRSRNLIAKTQDHSKKTLPQTLKNIFFILCAIIIFAGLLLSIYNLTKQKPPLLPYATGFQTAFASISQDSNRLIQNFLFGSGFGTYATDFARFKLPNFNQHENLWNLTFIKSSSFVLELLPTTGLLGITSFSILILTIVKQARKSLGTNPAFISLLIAALAAFILPFSLVIQIGFLVVLGIFAAIQRGLQKNDYFDVEVRFLAIKKGLQWQPVTSTEHAVFPSSPNVFPSIWLIGTILLVGIASYFSYRYFAADITFQNSLVAASQNKGLETYNEQINAIRLFPYRDAYHRIYSQTNLALANSLASSLQQQNSSPSAQVQQTIATLIQQSINSARNTTTLSPMTSSNWQNLASIYRSLIGFGQNAESFAIVAQQQAVLLDPSNPQQYLALGGIYFQLQQWENAQRQFQVALSLKPNYANAYYNLGHALEAKGELEQALSQYRRVQTLIESDKQNHEKITKEIEALEKKIGSKPGQSTASQPPAQPGTSNQELQISTPAAQLPARKEQIKIPPPNTATQSAQ